MKSLRVFLWFHRPERCFHKLSYNLEKLPVKINELNIKRMQLQKRITELSSISDICKICQGKCCGGNYNHFTQIDVLTRMYSDKPIKETGHLWAPKKLTFIVIEKLKEIMPFNRKKDCVRFDANIPAETDHCPKLEPTGCMYAEEDRPIRCILWTCKAMRNSLPKDTLKELGQCTKKLGEISLQVLKEYQNCYK